jgi:hypothetical protein
MGEVSTIEVDLAKSVFQVHGISATGEVLIRRQVRRGQVLKWSCVSLMASGSGAIRPAFRTEPD